jgi:perosamine synthetase
MRSPLSTHLSPNVEKQDIVFAAVWRFLPWKWAAWRAGNAVDVLHKRFTALFQAECAFSYDNGRTALQSVLEALELPSGAGVVVQGFSCIVVPNAVKAAQLRPVFIDIDGTYNIDAGALDELLESDPSIGAVVVQHTFGVAADMEPLVEVCRKHDVRVVEDCAHALGVRYRGLLLGTLGDAAIFSFGRDKVLSTVSGGIAIANSPELAERLSASWSALPIPSRRWIAKRLNHPLIFALALPTYYLGSLGKVIIALAKRLQLFPWVLTFEEKHGEQPAGKRMPNVLAEWALSQLVRLDRFNDHRRKIAAYYSEQLGGLVQLPQLHSSFDDAIFFRYTIKVERADELLKMAKNSGILLGDWYRQVLAPEGCDLASVGYEEGFCPAAEKAITQVVNLPTHINVTLDDAKRVVDVIKKHLNA